MAKRSSVQKIAFALAGASILSLALVFIAPTRLSFGEATERSLLLKQGQNQSVNFASAPFTAYQPLTLLEGASSGAYVDCSFFASRKDCSFNYGADGSGYWFKEYVGESAGDEGVFSFNILHPSKLTLVYSLNDQSAGDWRFDFYSAKNGGGSVASHSFTPTAYITTTVEITLASLAIAFSVESLSFFYKLDSIYSLIFHLNSLRIDYRC
jgi:hypothetical protein